MGTWGSGVLDNDSAQDFLEEFASRDPRGRFNKISQVLNSVADNPAALMRQLVPEEVIAAVAIVAASVPADESYEWAREISDVCNQTLSSQEAYELSGVALHALNSVVGDEHGWWQESWVSESDRMRANGQVQEIISVLDRQRR